LCESDRSEESAFVAESGRCGVGDEEGQPGIDWDRQFGMGLGGRDRGFEEWREVWVCAERIFKREDEGMGNPLLFLRQERGVFCPILRRAFLNDDHSTIVDPWAD
jgi:hypothetical protein